jgi:hypothetical protein
MLSARICVTSLTSSTIGAAASFSSLIFLLVLFMSGGAQPDAYRAFEGTRGHIEFYNRAYSSANSHFCTTGFWKEAMRTFFRADPMNRPRHYDLGFMLGTFSEHVPVSGVEGIFLELASDDCVNSWGLLRKAAPDMDEYIRMNQLKIWHIHAFGAWAAETMLGVAALNFDGATKHQWHFSSLRHGYTWHKMAITNLGRSANASHLARLFCNEDLDSELYLVFECFHGIGHGFFYAHFGQDVGYSVPIARAPKEFAFDLDVHKLYRTVPACKAANLHLHISCTNGVYHSYFQYDTAKRNWTSTCGNAPVATLCFATSLYFGPYHKWLNNSRYPLRTASTVAISHWDTSDLGSVIDACITAPFTSEGRRLGCIFGTNTPMPPESCYRYQQKVTEEVGGWRVATCLAATTLTVPYVAPEPYWRWTCRRAAQDRPQLARICRGSMLERYLAW